MVKTLIIYATDYGNTKKMAESVASGAQSVQGAQVTIKIAQDVKQEDLLAHDAIILGTPVHMGSPDWRVKKFIDEVCSPLWMKDKLISKVGGVFATGGGFGNAGGGCEIAMLALLNNLAELGMIIVPLPKNSPGYKLGGLQWGPYARSGGVNMEPTGVSSESLEAGYHHGANITRLAEVVKGKVVFATQENMAVHK